MVRSTYWKTKFEEKDRYFALQIFQEMYERKHSKVVDLKFCRKSLEIDNAQDKSHYKK